MEDEHEIVPGVELLFGKSKRSSAQKDKDTENGTEEWPRFQVPHEPQEPQHRAPRSARRAKVSASLYNSPYLREPFKPRPAVVEPLTRVRTPRERTDDGVRFARVETAPRRYRAVGHPSIGYEERRKIFERRSCNFFEGLKERYIMEMGASPYNLDMRSFAAQSRYRSERAQREREIEDREARRVRAIEAKAAIKAELARKPVVHGDEFFNSHYAALRVIPVTDRREKSSRF